MIETGIPGEDAPQKVLHGKHYNNGMRAHLCSRGNDQSEAGCLPTIAPFSWQISCVWHYIELDKVKKDWGLKKQWQLDWLYGNF